MQVSEVCMCYVTREGRKGCIRYASGKDVESFVMPLLLCDNPTCASGCQVFRKSVLERDALFMGWNVMSFLVFSSGGHSLTVSGEGTPLKLVIPWRTKL